MGHQLPDFTVCRHKLDHGSQGIGGENDVGIYHQMVGCALLDCLANGDIVRRSIAKIFAVEKIFHGQCCKAFVARGRIVDQKNLSDALAGVQRSDKVFYIAERCFVEYYRGVEHHLFRIFAERLSAALTT